MAVCWFHPMEQREISMLHHFSEHEKQKTIHSSNLVLRNKLQLVGRNLLSKAYQVKGNERRTQLECTGIIGEINGYLACRRALLPSIAADGYMRDLEGMMDQLKKMDVVHV